ncbi:MAG: DUF1572 family protein [Ignavibacteriae bacterium]|nr:DUF1572 family protein [Ignavibacteriota bacterium]
MDSNLQLANHYLDVNIKNFKAMKALADKAIAQLSYEQFKVSIDGGESNSIEIIIKHLAGNMISRWSDIFTTDGEKPTRNRDTEFISSFNSTQEILEYWERGWKQLFDTLSSLTPDDLLRTITIRTEPHTVVQAIERQVYHYGSHIGQIIFLAKHLAGENWRTLSIPRGKSEEYLSKPLQKAAV